MPTTPPGRRTRVPHPVVFVVAAVLVGLTIAAAVTPPADAADETYTAVTPCASFDSRVGQGGPGTLLGLQEWQVQLTGSPTGQGGTGECGIPSSATAVQVNVVAVNPLTDGNVRVFPPGGTYDGGVVNYQTLDPKLNNSNAAIIPISSCRLPLSSREKCLILQPNAGAAGAVPTVDVRGIVLGYLDEGLSDDLADLEATVTAQAGRIADLEALLAGFTRESVDGYDTVRLTGANLQLVDGTGDTPCDGGDSTPGTHEACNGYGNLIIGYHENVSDVRTGAHGLVIGENHSYSSYGHLVVGLDNTTTHQNASVSGGAHNEASGAHAAVSGGDGNTASGADSSVSGGHSNEASGESAAVSGGGANTASGARASVSGGNANTASDSFASASGGYANEASGVHASVTGGRLNTASGLDSAVTGGGENTASGVAASVTGGGFNIASAGYASVTGGGGNSASGPSSYTTVTGGTGNTAEAYASSVTGGTLNTATNAWASVTGGSANDASGSRSSVTGGVNNVASGYASTVTGGRDTTAAADYANLP